MIFVEDVIVGVEKGLKCNLGGYFFDSAHDNRSWDNQNVVLHVLALGQLHDHFHVLDLLSFIWAADSGTVDWQVEDDKMGEGVVAHNLEVHTLEEGQGHFYFSTGNATGSSWLVFDASE